MTKRCLRLPVGVAGNNAKNDPQASTSNTSHNVPPDNEVGTCGPAPEVLRRRIRKKVQAVRLFFVYLFFVCIFLCSCFFPS